MTAHDDAPRNSWVARSRRDDVLVELLAYEIAKYAPRLAKRLASEGGKRLTEQLR